MALKLTPKVNEVITLTTLDGTIVRVILRRVGRRTADLVIDAPREVRIGLPKPGVPRLR
jgi:hypothetical protein